ncbi:hypothetical protein NP493_81g02013 [Ridgeia piscesae]|uniref:Uncharacterized protein n=1 Tax=Ridgeia piscesae TaxID=27915 RepID=A0AAD9P9H7_RIDPI|nr:hypothetical protein NP493_81g02013 [Ridgeia piscesae]
MSPNKTSLCKTPTESKSIDCVDQTSSAKEQQERPSAPRTVLLTSFFKCRAREPPMLPMTQTTPAPQLKPGLADQEMSSPTAFVHRKTPSLPLKPSRPTRLDDSGRQSRGGRGVGSGKDTSERPLHTSCTGARTRGPALPARHGQAATEETGLQESLVSYLTGDATFLNIGDMPAYVVHKALTQHNGHGIAQTPITADQKCLQWLQGLYQ